MLESIRYLQVVTSFTLTIVTQNSGSFSISINLGLWWEVVGSGEGGVGRGG